VLLSVGRRGTPRKLDVPGEELAESVLPPDRSEPVSRQSCAGCRWRPTSALESALALAAEPGTTVTLAHRSEAFSGAKPKTASASKRPSKVAGLGSDENKSHSNYQQTVSNWTITDNRWEIPNDVVIVCAGGTLPIPLLKESGCGVETRYGT